MNLLPKTHVEFSEKQYWNKFFAARGNKAFEWYGEYPELSEQLNKYMRHKDDILMLGCGNSNLSCDLYDVGYSKITNIDISHVVIKQMQSKNKDKRSQMKYQQMDALNMSFPNESFSVAVDKGTLDALMPDDKPETISNATAYFDEIHRILRFSGRFICISLLQEHILNALLDYFPRKNCMMRVTRCFECEHKARENGENSMPVFVIICTKFKALPSEILELNLSSSDKFMRLKTPDEMRSHVSDIQKAAFTCMYLKKNSLAATSEVSIDLHSPGEQTARYSVHVVDIPKERDRSEYAAFVVPHGRGHEWLFSTAPGRRKLVEMCKCNRLAVVLTHAGHEYGDLQAVQGELSDVVVTLAPNGCSRKILFLSLGADIGKRTVRFKGDSKFSGTYIVEDSDNGSGDKYRRLYYHHTQSVIQSEGKLKSVKTRGGNTKDVVDHKFLTCKHHIYMTIPTFMACTNNPNSNVAVVGLGGGSLCSFLRSFLPKTEIIGVDIDADMLKVATDWFGLRQDDKLKVTVADGLKFLSDSEQTGVQYNAILFDVDSKDSTMGMSCPPKQFLTSEALETVMKCLKREGLFVLNIVLRDEMLRLPIMKNLRAMFPTVTTYKLEEDLNEIVTCSMERLKDETVRRRFREAQNAINEFFVRNKLEKIEDCLETLKINE